MGRLFTDDDDKKPDAHPVAVLDHQYWRRRFSGRAGVIGATIRVNSYPMTIIGVAPEGFSGTQSGRYPALFVPMMMKARMTPGNDNLTQRNNRWLQMMARLKPGVSFAQAEAGFRAALQPTTELTLNEQQDLPAEEAARVRSRKAYLVPGAQGRENLRNEAGEALLILLGMTGLVVLVACANVANLLIARGAARSREIAIRLSVGASRGMLVRQLLMESLLLASLGGLAGYLFASWGLAALQTIVPADSRELLSVALDLRTLAITMGLALVTGLVFGLLPALQSTRGDLASAMKDQGNSTTLTPGSVRFRRLLVSAQFALSLVLLIAGGLLARSLGNIARVNPGFEIERLVTFRMNATLSGYPPEKAPEAYFRLRDKLAAMPGVRAVGAAQVAVLSDMNMGTGMKIDGCKAVDRYGRIEMLVNSVDAGYFRAMQIPLRDGREFHSGDHVKSQPVVIVNETLTRQCFGNQPAVGRWVTQEGKKRLIVGVVKDSLHSTLRQAAEPFIYFPMSQAPRMTYVFYYLRTAMPEAAVTGATQRVVREFDSNLAVLEPRTMREQINETVVNERMSAFLSAVFALLAVVLAAVGLYGVLAFMVTSRTREIGIRIALGAEPRRVEWMVLREVLLLAGLSLAAGLPAAFALAQVMKSLLFGVSVNDPLVFAGATALLLTAALAAGYWPARRASRISPLRALRYD